MSGLIVGLVLRSPITDEFNTEAKFIATVYADHAWEDGTHAYPAVDTVAGITGLSDRTVQRYLRALESIGMLILDGKGPRGTNRYKFPIEEGKDGSVRLSWRRGDSVSPQVDGEKAADSGDSLTGCHADGGDRESGDRESGDTGVTQTNNPSLVVVVVNADIAKISKLYEKEIGALTAMSSDSIKDTCDTYPADWIEEAIQIAVDSNIRTWKYVNGILRNCKAKNVRPSLNKLEAGYGNTGRNSSGTTKGKAGARQGRKTDNRAGTEYSAADLAAADLINKAVGMQ